MNDTYSKDALIQFIDDAISNGEINQFTGQAKKSAVSSVFHHLYENESADLRETDFDLVFDRFQKENEGRMESGSIATYKSRAKKALEEFLEWRANPEQFSFKTHKSRASARREHDHSPRFEVPPIRAAPQRIELRIREDVLIQIINLPFDLRQEEADRIKKIIDAYVS